MISLGHLKQVANQLYRFVNNQAKEESSRKGICQLHRSDLFVLLEAQVIFVNILLSVQEIHQARLMCQFLKTIIEKNKGLVQSLSSSFFKFSLPDFSSFLHFLFLDSSVSLLFGSATLQDFFFRSLHVDGALLSVQSSTRVTLHFLQLLIEQIGAQCRQQTSVDRSSAVYCSLVDMCIGVARVWSDKTFVQSIQPEKEECTTNKGIELL